MTKIGKLEVRELGRGTQKEKGFLMGICKRKAAEMIWKQLYFEAFEQHLFAYALYGEKIMTPEQIQKAAEELMEEAYGGRMSRPGVRYHKYEIAQAMLEHAGLTEEASKLEEQVQKEIKEYGRSFHGCLWGTMYAFERPFTVP